MAVEDAAVRQQDLQQADAPPIGGIGVADAHALGRPQPLAVARIALRGAGRRAGCVVLGRIGKYLQFLSDIELRHQFDICSEAANVDRSAARD